MPRRFVMRFANTSTDDPADDVVWQWHELEDPDDAGATPEQTLAAFRNDFIQAWTPSGIGTYIANDMLLYDWRLYPLPIGDPVAQIVESTNPVTVGSSVGPAEVAVAVTMLSTSGIRDKPIGRSYVGRLSSLTWLTGAGRLGASGMNAIGNFFSYLHALRTFDDVSTPVRYSPTTGNSQVIQKYRVDNALDTQRRRGISPTVSTVFEPELPPE